MMRRSAQQTTRTSKSNEHPNKMENFVGGERPNKKKTKILSKRELNGCGCKCTRRCTEWKWFSFMFHRCDAVDSSTLFMYFPVFFSSPVAAVVVVAVVAVIVVIFILFIRRFPFRMYRFIDAINLNSLSYRPIHIRKTRDKLFDEGSSKPKPWVCVCVCCAWARAGRCFVYSRIEKAESEKLNQLSMQWHSTRSSS